MWEHKQVLNIFRVKLFLHSFCSSSPILLFCFISCENICFIVKFFLVVFVYKLVIFSTAPNFFFLFVFTFSHVYTRSSSSLILLLHFIPSWAFSIFLLSAVLCDPSVSVLLVLFHPNFFPI